MSRSWWLAAAALSLSACNSGGSATSPSSPSASPSSPASAADPAFNQAVLHEVRLDLDPADWQALLDNFRSNQYYAARVSIDGESLSQVGIRSRGAGTRNGVKPGLRVDFNRYLANQEFLGLKALVLDNAVYIPIANWVPMFVQKPWLQGTRQGPWTGRLPVLFDQSVVVVQQ